MSRQRSTWLPRWRSVTWSIEPRAIVPPWLPPAISTGAIATALLIGGAILSLAGGDPIATYVQIGRSSFGNLDVFSDTLVKAIPLILVGLACALAFRMRLWNIGAEGQFFMGAWGASAVVLTPLVGPETPGWITISAMMIAGLAAGAAWGFIPGWLKARYTVNEIISTLMLNYIAIAWNDFFIFGVWSEGGFQLTRTFPRNAWLPRLTDYADLAPRLAGMTTHLGLVFGLLAAVLVWLILYRSRWGYEIRLIGDNQHAAVYAGIPLGRRIIMVMMLSGALAGLAGMSEVSGAVHRLQGAISSGYGFTGVIIAWLAKLNPFAIILVSVLFGALILAGREIQPSGIPRMIQGVVLVSLIASEFLLRYRVSVRVAT